MVGEFFLMVGEMVSDGDSHEYDDADVGGEEANHDSKLDLCKKTSYLVGFKQRKLTIKLEILGINIGNPFRDIHTHPTHVSFVSASENTEIEASLGCAAEFGDICAHSGECKKVDDNLVCKSASQYHNLAGGMNGLRTFEQDRCMCRETNMKWKYELKKCVMA